ncbi:MAG: hypothetical protein JWQ83_2229 [Lacunisphaera sp.]|nr:hypothetical protein [Lacunisphaera sp.]
MILRLRAVLLGIVLAASYHLTSAAPLRVGIDLAGEPMTFVDAKGVPQGFAVDIMTGVGREMGVPVVFVAQPWLEMIEDFRAGRTDALANITYTPARAEFIDFSDPHVVMSAAVFVRKGDHRVRNPIDLGGLRVAVKPSGAPLAYLEAKGWADHLVPRGGLRDALHAVAAGDADAALEARPIGLKVIRDERLNLEAAEVDLADFAQRQHIGVHRGDVARIALINEGLARLRANGAYDRIYNKWMGPLEPGHLRFRDVQPYLPAAAGLLGLVLGVLTWQRRLLQRMARQAEALRLSEERLTLVLEGSEAGFWDWDLRTGHVERSDRWAAMLGYARAEIPQTVEGGRQLVHPDDLKNFEFRRVQHEAGITGRYDLEYRMRAKSGEWRWIHDRGKIVAHAPDGTPLRMTGTHTNITQFKAAETEREALRLKMIEGQKLESLGVLAGGIAHDFNNLLTVVLANTALAREFPGDGAELAGRLAQIETAARRAADLCRQMLAYAGKGNFVVGRVDLGKLVRDTAQLLEVSLSKKARLSLTLGENLPAVEADASQLQQVVMNLVINASEALGERPGEIRLVTSRSRPQPVAGGMVHAFGPPDADGVCLEITDTGQGMDAATLARIFDPFFTTKFAGRGLGLAAVLGIVRACQGTLAVSSGPGRGTTFRLFLPAVPGDAAGSTPPVPMPAPRVAGGTVLVADDEAAVRSAAVAMLKHHGYATMEAANGSEAVEKFRASPQGFKAVLLDLTMPGLNGAEVLREIRALNPAVCVLMMSGFSPQEVLSRLPGLGPVTILHKPFTIPELLDRLDEAITV